MTPRQNPRKRIPARLRALLPVILGMAALVAGLGYAHVYGRGVPASSGFAVTPPIDVPPTLTDDATIGYR
jgi:hypothetical protein